MLNTPNQSFHYPVRTHLLHRSVLLLFVIGAFLRLGAQPKSAGAVDPALAAEHYSHGNFVMALPLYVALAKKEYKNTEYNQRAGICYLRTNIDKKAAIPFFEYLTKQPNTDPENWYYLGQAYHFGYKFDEAIKAYQNYSLKATSSKDKAKAQLGVSQCQNAKLLVKRPLDVTFENAGKEINTEFPDYYPFVTSDESMLVFTSRRKGNLGAGSVEMDGYYASDIWLTRSQNGLFQKAKNAGGQVNGTYDEQTTGLSADGSWMTVYIDNITTAGDIYLSPCGKTPGKPVKMGASINEGFETAASLSPDGNQIYFASRRDEGEGETDIWIARKLPNGEWGKAQNLSTLNTPYREDFPFMSADGHTLYFASEGHNSMGGFDLFMSVWNEEDNTWSTPQNLGYPINTPEDNRTICFTENNRIAYISATREGGMGDLDIWRVVFNDVQQESFTAVVGKILPPDSAFDFSGVLMNVTNTKTQESVGDYRPNPRTGRYVLALPPGKYVMTVDAPGCKQLIETIIVFDIGAMGEQQKDIRLLKESP